MKQSGNGVQSNFLPTTSLFVTSELSFRLNTFIFLATPKPRRISGKLQLLSFTFQICIYLKPEIIFYVIC